MAKKKRESEHNNSNSHEKRKLKLNVVYKLGKAKKTLTQWKVRAQRIFQWP